MSVYWDVTKQYLSRSFGHVPEAWESFYTWEDSACWNCGGEFTVERLDAFGAMEHKPCWLCNFTGTLSFSSEPIPFQLSWYYNPELYNLKYMNGESNFWEPW